MLPGATFLVHKSSEENHSNVVLTIKLAKMNDIRPNVARL